MNLNIRKLEGSIVSRLDRIIGLLTAPESRQTQNIGEQKNDDELLSVRAIEMRQLAGDLAQFKAEINHQHTLLKSILGSIDEVFYVRNILPDNPLCFPFSFVSERSIDIIGLSAVELELDPNLWLNAVHPDEKALVQQMHADVLKGNELVSRYRVFHSLKRSYRWIEDRMMSRRNAAGQIENFYGSLTDVTKQQQTALELVEKSKLIERLINSSDQVFYIVSVDQANSFLNTFTYLSPQVEQVIGYTISDIRKDTLIWFKEIHPDDLEAVKQTTKEMFSKKEPRTRVYRMKHKRTGSYVWLEDYVVPILSKTGRIQEFYASARDITARKQAEIERETLIRELSVRHDELMQFSHIVSHNLRSPVAGILGLSEILVDAKTEEEQRMTTSYIKKSACAIDGVLRDLNDILTVRSASQERMVVVSFTKMINSVCAVLDDDIKMSRATIHLEIQPGADEINSIKSYLQSALYNLISNAIKYRSRERQLQISIKIKKCEGRTSLCVEDNGMGIDLNVNGHRLFVLYSRLASDQQGKGLGLFMTKTQIETLKGNITVSSEIGKGTTFTIVL